MDRCLHAWKHGIVGIVHARCSSITLRQVIPGVEDDLQMAGHAMQPSSSSGASHFLCMPGQGLPFLDLEKSHASSGPTCIYLQSF